MSRIGRVGATQFLVFVGLIVGLIAAALLSAATGQIDISYAQTLASVAHHLHLNIGTLPDNLGETYLWDVRFPRVVLGIVVGAALATAGALLQGVFANPLAEPGIIGVSSGAAAGASAVILFAGVGAASASVAGGAFLAGLGTSGLVYFLARSQGRTEVVSLVLTGIAINAFAGGLIAYFTFRADPTARDRIVFWQLGSLREATWSKVWLIAPIVLIGIAAAIWLARSVDLLSLGEYSARHLGVNVELVRSVAVVIVAVLTAAAVAFCGIILFVGLVIPHIMRLALGPANRVLIPASALAGAILLVLADLGARTLVENADLPIGILTSVIGGPVFLLLLRREFGGAGERAGGQS